MGSLIYKCVHCGMTKDPAAPCGNCGCADTGLWQGDKKPNGSPVFFSLLGELADLHERKNRGYAGYSIDPFANFRQCEAFGISVTDGVITRMSDKWSRLQSLWNDAENDQVGESIEDTLKDLAAYALILICLLREGSA